MKITTTEGITTFKKNCNCGAPIVVTSTDGDYVDEITIHDPVNNKVIRIELISPVYGDDLRAVCSRCGVETSPDYR